MRSGNACGDGFDSFWDSLVVEVERGTRIAYAIVTRDENQVVGTTSFLNIRRDHHGVEVGTTFIHPDHRSGPVNPESKRLMLNHAFTNGAVRAEFMVDVRNARMFEKILPELAVAGSEAVVVGAGHLVGTTGLLNALRARLRDVRVVCGDWRRCLSATPLNAGNGCAGIVLDPPYADGDAQYAAGGTGTTLSADVRAWAIEHGDDPRFRIVLCGYEGEHAMPRGWRCKEWKALGGYGNAAGNENARRERLWLSPFCVEQPPKQRSLFEEVSR